MSTTLPAKNGAKEEQKQVIPVHQKFDPMYGLRSAMNRLFDDFSFGGPFDKLANEFGTWTPRVDVKETEKEMTVTAELPGVKKDDIDVQLLNDTLVLSGEKTNQKEESKANYHRTECYYGYFQRVLPLPAGLDRDAISANIDHGVLTIKMPKTKQAQESSKKIEVK